MPLLKQETYDKLTSGRSRRCTKRSSWQTINKLQILEININGWQNKATIFYNIIKKDNPDIIFENMASK